MASDASNVPPVPSWQTLLIFAAPEPTCREEERVFLSSSPGAESPLFALSSFAPTG